MLGTGPPGKTEHSTRRILKTGHGRAGAGGRCGHTQKIKGGETLCRCPKRYRCYYETKISVRGDRILPTPKRSARQQPAKVAAPSAATRARRVDVVLDGTALRRPSTHVADAAERDAHGIHCRCGADPKAVARPRLALWSLSAEMIQNHLEPGIHLRRRRLALPRKRVVGSRGRR